MKVIENFILLAMLVLLSSGHADAQSIPKRFTNTVYEVRFPKVSNDKNWMAFQKEYEYNSDTLSIVQVKKPDRLHYQKADAIPFFTRFTPKNYLFSKGKDNAELIKLPSLEVIRWSAIDDGLYDEKNNVIIIRKQKFLSLLSEDGRQIAGLENVKNILKKGEANFAVVEEQGRESLYRISGKGFDKIYSSPYRISDVLDDSESGTVVLENHENEKYVRWVQGSRIQLLALDQDIIQQVRSAEVVSLHNNYFYFAKLLVKKKRRKNDAVDIWYSEDNSFETKFYSDIVEYTFLWKADTNKAELLSNADDKKFSYFGNPKYLLYFDPFQHQNYSNNTSDYSFSLYDVENHKIDTTLVMKSNMMVSDGNGRYILSVHHGFWNLVNLHDLTRTEIPLRFSKTHKYGYPKAYFSLDLKRILFENTGRMYQYDLVRKKLSAITTIKGFDAEIINGQRKSYINGFDISANTYNSLEPAIVKLYNRTDNTTSVGYYDGKTLKKYMDPTEDNISAIAVSKDSREVVYARNTMQQPQKIILNNRKTERTVYKTNLTDEKRLVGVRFEVISYLNENKDSLKGIIIYPLRYEEGKKYPMIVSIYEKQRHLSNKYLRDGFKGPSDGFNIRNFIEKGYFVFLPDIVFSSKGTGLSALDCVHSGLDALQNIRQIDYNKVGLIGFSHGGYETNFIATHSRRFAAFVAGAGNSDLVRSYFSYNYNFNSPFYWQFENGQYEMNEPFYQDKNLYIKNSPVYFSDQVSAPVLLWTGTKDQNINWEQTMEEFLSLQRSGKKAVALFYADETHGLSKIKNKIDLFTRVEDWFDHFLRLREVEWIDK